MAQDRPDPTIAEREAADWFTRLNAKSISARTLEDFYAWRRKPANDDAYGRMETLWETSRRLRGDPDIARSVAAALAKRPWWARLADRLRARPRLRYGAAALVGAGVLVVALSLGGQSTYDTGVGEQRLVQLNDGSRVRLDTDSRVTVRYSDGRRDVKLHRGQAFFDVAHDVRRPFVVRAGDTQIRALGTRFDVNLAMRGVEVTLVQGAVEVSRANAPARETWRLDPGEAVKVGAAGAPDAVKPAPKPVDVEAATSWTTGRLIFQQTPLASAVETVNRYSQNKIVIEDQDLRATPVNGAFDAGDTEAFVTAVSDLFGLEAVRHPGGVITLAPRAAS